MEDNNDSAAIIINNEDNANTNGEEIHHEEPGNKTLDKNLDIDLEELARKEKEAQKAMQGKRPVIIKLQFKIFSKNYFMSQIREKTRERSQHHD